MRRKYELSSHIREMCRQNMNTEKISRLVQVTSSENINKFSKASSIDHDGRRLRSDSQEISRNKIECIMSFAQEFQSHSRHVFTDVKAS